MDLAVSGGLGVLPAANKVSLGIEGLHQAVAVPVEVVGHEIAVDLTVEAQDAIACTISTCVDVGNDENS